MRTFLLCLAAVFFLSACQETDQALSSSETQGYKETPGYKEPSEYKETSGYKLEQVRWQLQSLSGDNLDSTDISPYIEFDLVESRVSGNSGCNQFTGGYNAEDNRLNLGMLASTRMACLDENAMRLEQDFLQALSRVDAYSISGNLLTFSSSSSSGTPVAVFTAVSE